MDDAGCLWCLRAFLKGPGPRFWSARREEGFQSQQFVGCPNQPVQAGFFNAFHFQEVSLFFFIHFGNLFFSRCRYANDLAIALNVFFDGIHVLVGIWIGHVFFSDVGNVQDRLARQQE